MDELNRFPTLVSLKISRQPALLKSLDLVKRQQLVARVAGLLQLNSSDVRRRGDDAEKIYLHVVERRLRLPPPMMMRVRIWTTILNGQRSYERCLRFRYVVLWCHDIHVYSSFFDVTVFHPHFVPNPVVTRKCKAWFHLCFEVWQPCPFQRNHVHNVFR